MHSAELLMDVIYLSITFDESQQFWFNHNDNWDSLQSFEWWTEVWQMYLLWSCTDNCIAKCIDGEDFGCFSYFKVLLYLFSLWCTNCFNDLMWWYVDSVPVVVVVWWCLYTHTFHPPAPGNISRNMPWPWSRPLVSLITGMQEHNCCYKHGFSFIIILLVITSIYKIYRYWGFYLAFHSMP